MQKKNTFFFSLPSAKYVRQSQSYEKSSALYTVSVVMTHLNDRSPQKTLKKLKIIPQIAEFGGLFVPLHPVMDIKRKRRISAWLLLSVFLPVMLFSSLHVHAEAPDSSACLECINHIPHHGHLSLDTIHLNDCLLCHFASLPFLAAVVIMVIMISAKRAVTTVQPSGKLQLAACRLNSSRAPPVVI